MEIRTHKYARLAYPLIEAIEDTEIESKYRTLALTFPTMIMQSGLVQAIGFLMAKNETHHKKLLEHIANLLGYRQSEAKDIEDLQTTVEISTVKILKQSITNLATDDFKQMMLNSKTDNLKNATKKVIENLSDDKLKKFLLTLEFHDLRLIILELDMINLYQEILSSDVTQYQLLTRKTLEASSWLKRYTQALLEKESENKGVNHD